METNKINVDNFQQIYFEERTDPLSRKEFLFFGLSFGVIVVSILIAIYAIVELVFLKLL